MAFLAIIVVEIKGAFPHFQSISTILQMTNRTKKHPKFEANTYHVMATKSLDQKYVLFRLEMPSSIKLTYFDARGRAETSRLILAYANVHFEDERLTGLCPF